MFKPPAGGADRRKQQIKAMVIIAIGVAVLITFGVFYALQRGITSPTVFITIGLAVLTSILAPLIALRSQNKTEAATSKVKRGLDGSDMYTLIDRMVDDLDDDEADYLLRRLDDRERGLQRGATKDALEDLLDARDDASRQEWR